MNDTAYFAVLFICLLFNTLAFMALWLELKSQRKRGHDLRDQMARMYAGVVNVLIDHAQRLAAIEGNPFRPTSVMEKLENEDIEIRFKR